jgi:hypothetical protein
MYLKRRVGGQEYQKFKVLKDYQTDINIKNTHIEQFSVLLIGYPNGKCLNFLKFLIQKLKKLIFIIT